MTGCGVLGPGGELTAAGTSAERRVKLTGSFDRAVYGHDRQENLTVILLDGPADAPTQAAVIRMFWMPKAGATPIAESATNASVHYCIFAGADKPRPVGVYSGAGFFYPKSDLGGANLKGQLWEASLQLADRSEDFRDLLGQSILRGQMTATKDEARVSELLHQLNVEVNNALGYPRLVHNLRRPRLAGQTMGMRRSASITAETASPSR
jgi:hypothetical protein